MCSNEDPVQPKKRKEHLLKTQLWELQFMYVKHLQEHLLQPWQCVCESYYYCIIITLFLFLAYDYFSTFSFQLSWCLQDVSSGPSDLDWGFPLLTLMMAHITVSFVSLLHWIRIPVWILFTVVAQVYCLIFSVRVRTNWAWPLLCLLPSAWPWTSHSSVSSPIKWGESDVTWPGRLLWLLEMCRYSAWNMVDIW